MTKSITVNDQEATEQASLHQDGLGFPFQSFDSASLSAPKKEPELTYTAQDLANAVDEAREATALDVEARTRTAVAEELNHRQVQALETIRDQFLASEEAFRSRLIDVASTAQSLAKMMGQAIVPKALELHPLADIADMVRQSLVRLADQPSIEIRMADELVDQMTASLKDLVAETGFQGEATAVADAALGVGEARLAWTNGMAERNLERIQEEVDILIQAWFDGSADHPPQDQTSTISGPLATEPNSCGEGLS